MSEAHSSEVRHLGRLARSLSSYIQISENFWLWMFGVWPWGENACLCEWRVKWEYTMTGLLTQSEGAEDYELATRIAKQVEGYWNYDVTERYGATVFVSPEAVRGVCDRGATLWRSRSFSDPPGPYKRVAAFVVLSRLYPFFNVGPLTSDYNTADWIVRFSALLIPPTVRSLKVTLDEGERALPPWRGFMSAHVKLEVLNWLRWLDNLESIQRKFGDGFHELELDRQARMILAASLMIENIHYLSMEVDAEVGPIRGRNRACLGRLDEQQKCDLHYDRYVE